MAATWPEEVDCFTVPHSRMKKLVNKYSKMILSTDFTDELHFKTLLQNLHNVFMEFKAHEQIENILIMRKLRTKLKAASVTSDAVCNCHSDNRLTEMLELVLDGFKLTNKSNAERKGFGSRLEEALEDFTKNFIPHMEEEEEVFQPMLMKYFTYEELIDLKAKVIYQHSITKLKENLGQYTEKSDVDETETEVTEEPEPVCHFDQLPNEISLKIFSYLNPKDLTRSGLVSQRWSEMTRDPSLWPSLHPVHWAQGYWSFYPEMLGGVDGAGNLSENFDEVIGQCVDEDADVDESEDKDEDYTDHYWKVTHEAKMIVSIVKYLLPQVGSGVKVCDLAYSKGISSSLVHKILKLCPNVETLDLTHTPVGDAAFKEYGVSGRGSKLRHLDLTGCTHITDATLFSLADANYHDFCDDDEKEDDNEMETEIEVLPPSCGNKLATCCGKMFGQNYPSAETHGNLIDTTCSSDAASTETNQSNQTNISSGTSCYCSSQLNASTLNLPFSCNSRLSPAELAIGQVPLNLSQSNNTLNMDNDVKHKDKNCCGSSICDCGQPSESSVKMGGKNDNLCFNSLCCHDDSGLDEGTQYNNIRVHRSQLRFLSLNGCYTISDQGLWSLCEGEGTPYLEHLDLSGCMGVTRAGIESLVATCHNLDMANLFYCNYMGQDPFHEMASGCRNLECGERYCCTNSYKE